MPLAIVDIKQLHASAYNNSTVNCKNWNSGGSSTPAGEELITFYLHSSAVLVLASIVNGVVTIHTSAYDASVTGASDAHNIAHPIVDGDGVLHCWFGMHAEPMTYWKGANSADRSIDHQSVPMTPGTTSDVLADGGNTASVFRTNLDEATNDFWVEASITFTTGALAGQSRLVSDYNGTTKAITVSAPFTGVPAGGDDFVLSPMEGSATYPYAIRLNNGNLFFSYRSGSSGNGDWVVKLYTTIANGGDGTWTEFRLIDAQNESPYPNGRIFYDHQIGRLWLCWNYTVEATAAAHHDLDAAYSDDGGITWRGALTDAVLTLPIVRTTTSATECRIRTQPTATGLINVGAACTDEAGSLVTVNVWSKDVNGASQFHCTFKNELGVWESVEMGEASPDFSYVTHTIAEFPNPAHFTGGNVRRHRGKFYYLYASTRRDTLESAAPSLWCLVADGPYPRSWTRHRVCDANFGSGAISINEDVWRERGLVSMLVQQCYEQPGGPVSTATPAYRYLLAPLQELTDTFAMGQLTPFARSVLVEHFRNIGTYTPTATHTAHLFEDGVEVSGGGYAAVEFDNDDISYDDATGDTKVVAIEIDFGTSSGSWGTPDEVRIKDANFNTLVSHAITSPVAIPSGKRVRIQADQITIVAATEGLAQNERHGLLDWLFGGAAYTPYVTTYGSFFAGAPPGGTQQGGRTAITQASTWSAATDGQSETIADIAIADQPAGTYWVEHDAAANGNLVCSALLPQAPSGGEIATGWLTTVLT